MKRQLFDRERLLQQLHTTSGKDVQCVQDIQDVQQQPAPIYGADKDELERRAAEGLLACRRLADATRTSEQGRSSILKGLYAGADIYTLFLEACDTISATTGDTVFNAQAREIIRTVYGRAAGEPQPLKAELESITRRMERLREYEATAPIIERDCIQRAYREHQQEAERVRAQINATGTK